jgi:hypothetical protein
MMGTILPSDEDTDTDDASDSAIDIDTAAVCIKACQGIDTELLKLLARPYRDGMTGLQYVVKKIRLTQPLDGDQNDD